MLVSRLMGRVKNFCRLFIAPPKQWTLPKKSQILIYDAFGAEIMAPYMSSYSVEVLALRGEAVNVPCLLRAIFYLNFWLGKPHLAYEVSYIRAVNPDVIVTFIDNSTNFYVISRHFPKSITIFLQNGMRGGAGDVFSSLTHSKEYHVDYMFVFNSEFGLSYQRFISGEYVAAGSLKNNHVKKQCADPVGSVLFISQFRNKPLNGQPFTLDAQGEPVLWDQFYSAERLVLRFLGSWCYQNKKMLRVAGCSSNLKAESDFFETCLNGVEWEFIPKSDIYGPYKLLDNAEIVVFVDSALGFESIGRGNKTAGFSCRGSIINDKSINFAWPASLPDNGPFWSNEPNEEQFFRVMSYLSQIEAVEWERIHQLYCHKIMEFDPGNTRFVKLLGRLLAAKESSDSH